MNQATVLLISRTTEMFANIKLLLEKDDIRTCQVERWEQAQYCIETGRPQLIALDCPESAVDMLAVCREIRSLFQGLLVLVSEDTDERLHILALDMGADLSMTSNLGVQLMSAQIKALLRRFAPFEPQALQNFGSLTVDANRRDVFVAGQAAQLSTIEFNVLWTLVKNASFVVSRDEIHQGLYNSPYNGYDRSIDLYISRIRQKIGDDPVLPRYLKTVHGVGYQFVASSAD